MRLNATGEFEQQHVQKINTPLLQKSPQTVILKELMIWVKTCYYTFSMNPGMNTTPSQRPPLTQCALLRDISFIFLLHF